jgi:hypothetical protein
MKFLKFILISFLYCIMYISLLNISASSINNKLETLSFNELISIDGMISGQNDIVTFIEFKIKNTDTEAMKKKILYELEKLKSK